MAKKIVQAIEDEVKNVYTALRHIKHNGIRYEAGELLELAEKEAAHLLGLGAVEPVAHDATEPPDNSGKSDSDDPSDKTQQEPPAPPTGDDNTPPEPPTGGDAA